MPPCIRVEIVGDSELVINWLNATIKCTDDAAASKVAFIQNSLFLLYHHQLIMPRRDSGDWFRHVFRELNTRADEAARVAYTHNKPHSTIRIPLFTPVSVFGRRLMVGVSRISRLLAGCWRLQHVLTVLFHGGVLRLRASLTETAPCLRLSWPLRVKSLWQSLLS